MGYWFENMEKMDIQEERRKTEEQRKRADKQQRKAREQQKRADEAEKKLIERDEQEIKVIVSLCRKFNAPEEETILQVMENRSLSYEEARKKVEFYRNASK